MQELYTDEELRDIRRQAQYHLGRVLYEGELDYDAAVSALEAALRLDPDNLRIEYYLGMAIRAQIEHNKMKRAENLLRDYLLKGAPLGHDEEVRQFLGVRKALDRSSH